MDKKLWYIIEWVWEKNWVILLFTLSKTVYLIYQGIIYSWNSGRLKFDPDEIPLGYNWILYTYENNQQLSREAICPGQTEPIVKRDNTNSQFLTLEKNWLPSGLWIPLEKKS